MFKTELDMMKWLGVLIVSFWAASVMAQQNDEFPYLGEQLEYKISYGWFPLGKARANIDSTMSYDKSGEPYFQTYLRASTVWYLSFIKNIDDLYMSRLRATDLKPLYSEVHTTKGGEKWDQTNIFDYDSMKVYLTGISNNPKKKANQSWVFDLNDRTYDIMGSYLFFRNLDFDRLNIGDSVMISTLEDHKIWDFGIEYAGKERIKFKGEKFDAHKVIVLFPVTQTFAQEKAVMFWVIETQGLNLPIRIDANMRVGRMRVEISGFKGKYKFKED